MAKAKNNRPGVTKKDGSVTEQGLVIQNITIRPVQRTLLDIEKWRNAHITAESINGSRVLLYDLYDDCLKDGFLKRLVAKRVLAVTKNKLKYVDKSGKEVEIADDILKLRQFRKLRQRIQIAKAWGIGVVELMNEGGRLKIFDVPKKHIRPEEGLIVFEQYGQEGISYRNPPVSNYTAEIGDWNDLGYLLEACACAIYKRGNIADWANYAQIFGMPFREARYDGFNEQVRIQLEKSLEAAASAAYAVLPKEAELTFHEQKGTAGSNELYDRLRTAMNEEMMVSILGATETTTSSKTSGYAQSETHRKTTDDVSQDDKEEELTVLNELVQPVLVNIGLLPDGGRFIYDEPVNIDEATKKVDMAIKLKTEGKVPIADDYFYEITGIPKPDNYDELKEEMKQESMMSLMTPTEPGQEQENENEKKPGKPAIPPAKKKLTFFDELRLTLADFFGPAHKS